MSSAETTAHRFLAAFYGGDRTLARDLLEDDFEFSGPFVQLRGADAFMDSASPLMTAARGYTLKRGFSDGDEVCSIYDVHLGDHKIAMADWMKVRNGRLAVERVYFDPTVLRAALSAEGQ